MQLLSVGSTGKSIRTPIFCLFSVLDGVAKTEKLGKCFLLPRGLCQHIDAMLRKFFWGSMKGERKAAWVSWDTLIMPKYLGGLGFQDTELFTLCVLAKQSWHLLKDPESLSSRLLKVVHYPDCNVLEAELGAHPSQVWRAICADTDVLKQGIVKRIGNGQTTNIWNQNWIPRDHMLRALHPKSSTPLSW